MAQQELNEELTPAPTLIFQASITTSGPSANNLERCIYHTLQLSPHHFWTYTSNLTTVVNPVLKFMINGTTSNLCSNIPVSPAYGVYISQLIKYF
jgi:hypothetical protein